MNRQQRGVTLLELLVALFIFALSAGTLLKIAGENANHSGRLETRYFASLVAQNHLVELHLRSQWPAKGQRNLEVELGGRRWQLSEQVKTTDNPLVREVIAQVYAVDGDGNKDPQMLTELRSFMGETP